jgi:AcrR family transcriptional regulator
MVRGPGKKQDIIDAAIAILSSEGAPGLTASALAARAGVSKANLFHHFESLDDIVIAALERFLTSIPAMAPVPGTPLRAWLMALGAQTVELMEAQQAQAAAYVAFMARAQSDERLRARLAGVLESMSRGLAATLDLLAPGRWPPAEVERLAYLILMAGDGLAIHRQLFPDRADAQRAAWMALVDLIAPEETPP